jgi:3-phenylpropionate/cinnamic acid dioxygenase small subunit
MNEIRRVWPQDEAGRVPYWVPGPLRIVSQDGGGARTRHNLLVVQTLIDKQSEIVLAAACHDHLVPDGDRLRLRERIVVFDSEMIPNSLIYPA